MHEEIEAAVNWWGEQLSTQLSNKVLVERFRKSLDKELRKKFTGHWHVEDPPRGSGYRSVSYCTTVDPLLERAAEQAGLKSICKHISHTRHKVMWINPGHVKIRSTRAPRDEPPEYIFGSDIVSGSPSLSGTPTEVAEPFPPIPTPQARPTDEEAKTSETSDEDTHSRSSNSSHPSSTLTDRQAAKAPSTSSTHSTITSTGTHSIATTSQLAQAKSQLNANSAEFVPSQYSSHRGYGYENGSFGSYGSMGASAANDDAYYHPQPPEVLVGPNSKTRGFGAT